MGPDDILRYWFGEADDELKVIEEKGALWWGGGPALDAEIAGRFGPVVRAALAGECAGWAETPRGALAEVIALDQLTRNIGRGTAAAFTGDPRARACALAAIERGDDARLRPVERVFLYMPLEHAENRSLQACSVALFEALARTPGPVGAQLAQYVDFAVRHQVIVERFGRFPHRNRFLGRESSAEEIEFLKQPGSSFG